MEAIIDVSDAHVLKDNQVAVVVSKNCNQSIVYAIIDGNPYSKILQTADENAIKDYLNKADYPDDIKFYNAEDGSCCFISAYSISSIGCCVQEIKEKFCEPELSKSYAYVNGFKPEFYKPVSNKTF